MKKLPLQHKDFELSPIEWAIMWRIGEKTLEERNHGYKAMFGPDNFIDIRPAIEIRPILTHLCSLGLLETARFDGQKLYTLS